MRLTILLLLIIAVAAITAGAQNGDDFGAGRVSQRVVSDKTYNEVLDILFPRTQTDDEKTDWTIVLRFRPSAGSESQIVIRKTGSRFLVTEFSVRNGKVFNKLNAWFTENGREDTTEMSKLIQIDRNESEFRGSDFSRWLSGFFLATRSATRTIEDRSHEFEKTGSWSVRLHGTDYHCWFTAKGSQIYLRINDQELGMRVNGISPLARWMNRIRIQVATGHR